MVLTAIEGGAGWSGRRSGAGAGQCGASGPRLAALVCADLLSVELSDIYSQGRGPARVALARQSAAYLAHVVLAMTYEQVGRAFGRDRTTIAHACRRIEDLRDRPAFDRLIGAAEADLARLVAARSHLRLCHAGERAAR